MIFDWLSGRTGASKHGDQFRIDAPLDLLDPGFVQNPYPYYHWLRQHEPIHLAASGAWLLSRYDDVLAALKNPALGNIPAPRAVVHPRNRERWLCAEVANNIIPFQDGDEHAQNRRWLAKAWTRQMRESPPNIADLAERQWQQALAKGQFEALSDFATPLSIDVISEVIGIPPDRRQQMYRDSQYFFYLFTSFPSAAVRDACNLALARLRQSLAELFEPDRAAQAFGLIRQCLEQEQTADSRLLDHLILLFADGIENVDSGIASGLALLITHPDAWQALQQRPDELPAACDEILRYEAPAQFIGRVVNQDTHLQGQSLQAGEVVLLMLGSANRDEGQFPAGDTFDWSIDRPKSLAFGQGHHSCIGASLARQELEIALGTVLQQSPRPKPINPELQWQPRLGHRWLQELKLSAS